MMLSNMCACVYSIDRLLTVLRSKLDGLQCIYCERIFKDHTVLVRACVCLSVCVCIAPH
jgi:hypothetical protein